MKETFHLTFSNLVDITTEIFLNEDSVTVYLENGREFKSAMTLDSAARLALVRLGIALLPDLIAEYLDESPMRKSLTSDPLLELRARLADEALYLNPQLGPQALHYWKKYSKQFPII